MLIHNGLPNYIVNDQIKCTIKMSVNKINMATLQPINKHLWNFFTIAKYTTIIN